MDWQGRKNCSYSQVWLPIQESLWKTFRVNEFTKVIEYKVNT